MSSLEPAEIIAKLHALGLFDISRAITKERLAWIKLVGNLSKALEDYDCQCYRQSPAAGNQLTEAVFFKCKRCELLGLPGENLRIETVRSEQ